ncbi:hypothetical protein [Bordetella bronchiseptica]|uniref:hypothetical protein n=1 Tax=Bordetella bronchiseptica TaxID=518 RepID=UPI001268440A|nr:hypothetical protein [Bordetella bronchiseptica]
MQRIEVDLSTGDVSEVPVAPGDLGPPIDEPPVTRFSARDYLKRFTMAEYAAARTSANVAVQWALDNLIGAQFVDLDDPEVAAGLDLMVSEGIITAERKTDLLAPGL